LAEIWKTLSPSPLLVIFWTLAPAALAPASWRFLAYASAIAFGVGMGAMRVAMGAHFFTDVVFAGLFTFIIIVLAYGLIFGLPAGRPESKTGTPSKPSS